MTHRIYFQDFHDRGGKTVDITYVKKHLSTTCPDRLNHARLVGLMPAMLMPWCA
jgi:hypothetical protein